jgi:hypothetical protein
MQISHRIAGWGLISLLLLCSTHALPQTSENPEVTRLLAEARDKAAVLSRDADQMEALTRSEVSWQTHAEMLETVKQHVNDLARLAEKLTSERDSAAPWQQQAIDRMLPVLRELASNTTAAINHLNQNKIRPTTASYTEYLKENAEAAHQLAEMVSSFVQYGQARAKLEKLEQKLEIASR